MIWSSLITTCCRDTARMLQRSTGIVALATAAMMALPAQADGIDVTALADDERAALQSRFDLPDDAFETMLRIIDEGQNRNQIMEHLTYLCEEIGPRLTGSTNVERANHWVADQFRAFGLENVEVRQWGTIPVRFDRGPSTGKMVSPQQREFEFTARAWSAGTDGAVQGPVFREPTNDEEMEALREQADGAWILRSAAAGTRRGVVRGVDAPTEYLVELRDLGIAGLITASGDDRVRTSSIRGWRDLSFDDLPTEVTVTVRRSDYDAINSRLADGEEVIVEFDLDHTFVEGPIPVYNTIGEIRGSELPEEVVIVSGHVDSWDGPGSQGTVDNGTGTSVTMEAARILSAVSAQPKRTVRFILWTGEEQGLLGSRAYVEELSEEERARISAVFVDDSGTNHESSLTSNEAMAPILEWAVDPINYAFPDKQIEIQPRRRMPRRGASDHAAFNRVGVPGFFWGKSGRADYRYAWHTQNDRLDQAIPEYLIHNSTASAIVAYMVAHHETILPRDQTDDDEEAGDDDEASRERRRQRRDDQEGDDDGAAIGAMIGAGD